MSDTMWVLMEVLAGFLILSGVVFLFVAAVGLVRLPDFYNRMHASTKAMTLGIVSLVLGGGLLFGLTNPQVSPVDLITKMLLVILFQFLANPVGAHILSKAAHEAGYARWSDTLSDELAEDKQQGR